MHYDYVVTLKRENAHKTDLVSLLLLIFSLLAFIIVQIRNGLNLFLVSGIVVVLTGLLINLQSARKKKDMRFRYWLFATGICWVGMPYLQWMVIPFFILALMEAQAKYPLEIGFCSEGVVLNSLFNKKFPWSSLQSVILKDGILTLDFVNNKLIQKEVLDDDDPDAPEDEFNDYCRSKLLILR
ncbi:MAG TPA: hypothetical protein VHQ04_12000 [Puia sp.]|jgi:hypothetical protein|nr:hypothetical protein [Puia sp.]